VLVTLSGEVAVAREGAGSLCLEAGGWTDDLRAISWRGRRGQLPALEDFGLAASSTSRRSTTWGKAAD
jgi:hypothetical protein